MSKLMGQCNGCKRGIPFGYIPRVSKWQPVEYPTGMKVSKPVEIWCHSCQSQAPLGYTRTRRRFNAPTVTPEPSEGIPEAPAVPLKELALKIYRSMRTDKAFGSKTLAKLAGIKYTPDVKLVLRTLRDAGKVLFTEEKEVATMLDVTCNQCNEVVTVPCTDEQVKAWKGGELIQRAMPNLTPDEREILISGVCGPCFDKMFPEDE